MERKWYQRAFTLVELLVVIAIIAILAVVSIVGYSVFTAKAQDSVAQQELTQFIELLLSEDMESNYFEVNNKGLVLTTQKAKWDEDNQTYTLVDKTTDGDNKEGDEESKSAITSTKNVDDENLTEGDFNKLFVINDMLRWTGANESEDSGSAAEDFDIRLLLAYGMMVDITDLEGKFTVEWETDDGSTNVDGKATPETNESRFVIKSVSYELPNGGKATYEFVGSKG